ncbi:MAG: MmcQ/YjbR family DNA-binding protein [Enterococcus sp.]
MITREQVSQYIATTYQVLAERNFRQYPNYRVFRHPTNQKWFGLLMNVPKDKLGLSGDGELDILDVKVAPELIGMLIQKEGYFPAYHMNKEHWLSINLAAAHSLAEVQLLIDDSFKLTK